MATDPRPRSTKAAKPELDTEFANRAVDPFESNYMGVLRTNDPLLLERGQGSIAIYKDLLRDGKVFGCLQKRQLGLVACEWTVAPIKDSPKGAADAEAITAMLKAINFDELCKQLLKANLLGMMVAEIIWTVRDGFIVPARIVMRAHRRFVFVQGDPNMPPELRLDKANGTLLYVLATADGRGQRIVVAPAFRSRASAVVASLRTAYWSRLEDLRGNLEGGALELLEGTL